MEQQKKKWTKRYIWLILGLLFSFAVGMMKAGGSFHLDCFFEEGEVYEFAPEMFQRPTATWYYDSQQNMYCMLTNNSKKKLPKIKKNKPWKYMNVNIANLSQPYMKMLVVFYDANGMRLSEQEDIYVNGDNIIPIYYPGNFKKMKLIVRKQAGIAFTVNSFQLRDSALGFSKKDFFAGFLLTFLGYIVLTIFIRLACQIRIKKRNCYKPIEELQYTYTLFGDYCGSRVAKGLDSKVRSRIRAVLFFFLFAYNMLYQIFGLYWDTSYYRYGILISTLVIMLIALISWEKPLTYISWKGVLPLIWIALWIGVCFSDFVVSKHFKFIGYAFLIGVGFLFFVWNNMEKPKQIRNDMIHGLECTFPFVLVWCMFFRQRIDGIFYNGAYSKREDMAMYALVMFIAFLAEIFNYVVYSSIKTKEKWCMLYSTGAFVSAYFIWQTQVKTCIGAGTLILLLFFIKLYQEKRLYLKKWIVLATVISVFSVLAVHVTVSTLPEALGSNVVYEKDRYDIVYEQSAELVGEEVIEKTRSAAEVHKKAIWKNYVRKMNLFGNEKRLIVYEKYTMAYNGYLEMAYRYGLFILVPYTALLLLCLYHAVHEGGFLMLAVTVSFGIVSLTQNLEQPFASPLWLVFYLGMGIWFCDNKETDSRMEWKMKRTIHRLQRKGKTDT